MLNLKKIIMLFLFVCLTPGVLAAWTDPNPADHTLAYGSGADLVPSSCRTGNHLLWENKAPYRMYQNRRVHHKLVFHESHVVFQNSELPEQLKNPPAGGTLLNIKSLAGWKPHSDWRTGERMLVVILGTSGQVIWSSMSTDDLPTGGVNSYSRVNAGSVRITQPIGEIRVSHVDNSNYGIGGVGFSGSIYPDHVCIEYSAPTTYNPQNCNAPGFLETFGAGVGRSFHSPSVQTTYLFDDGTPTSGLGDGDARIQDGEYALVDKSSIASAGQWWIVDDDHTGDPNGRMLMVNSDYQPGEFYRQTVTGVEIGKTYSFAAYIANAYSDGDDIDPNVKFSLESGGVEITSVTTGAIAEDPGQDELDWRKYELVFTATQATFDIVLTNSSPGGRGNDIVIDDISLSEVCPPAQCYTLNDDDDTMYALDLDRNTNAVPITLDRTFNGEGAAYRSTDNAIYAFNQAVKDAELPSDLHKIDLDGSTSLVKANYLDFRASGAEFIRYSDGTEYFVVLMDQTESKIMFFDATDFTDNAALKTLNLKMPDGSVAHMSGMAINPANGEILVMQQRGESGRQSGGNPATVDPADYPRLYSVNENTGQLTLVHTFSTYIMDAESLAFAEDGNLYTESEDRDIDPKNSTTIFKLDLSTYGHTTVEGYNELFNTGNDVEALACTGSKIVTPVKSSISGTAYQDANKDSALDAGDVRLSDLKVSLYLDVNGDDTVDAGDTLVADQNSNANGDYLFTGLVAGNYLVVIDENDSDLPEYHSLSGTNPLSVNLAGIDSTNQNFPFVITACDALAGGVNRGVSPNMHLRQDDKIFLASTSNASGIEGHIKAYTVNADGLISSESNAQWDAASRMDKPKREAALYSSNSSNAKVKFINLDAEAYATNGIPDAATIESYTINPSHKAPVYLGNRKQDSFLGAISPDSNLVLLNDDMNVMAFLNDSAYRNFRDTTITGRPGRVIFTSDDGFLYAINQEDGELAWGWMPRSLVKHLKDYDTFADNHFMQGSIDVLDVKHGGQYATYVVGSYRQGLGQFVLKVSANGGLGSVVWDIDHAENNILAKESPNNGKRTYVSNIDGDVYSLYTITDSSGTSTLHIRNIADATDNHEVVLTFTSTSTPYVVRDFVSRNAPAQNVVYLGDSQGNIHSAALFNTVGSDIGKIRASSAIQTDLNTGTIGTLAGAMPITFIGVSTSSTTNGYYLRVQSEERITVFKYETSNGSWGEVWTAIAGGIAGKWVNGTFVADSSIQSIPSGATITSNATMVSNSIVLPVAHSPTGNNCDGDAYYYFYSILDGKFPEYRFFNTNNNSAITSIVQLGKGNAQSLQLSNLPSKNSLLGVGIADQKTDGSTGINKSMYIKDSITSGIRGWREIR